MYQRTVTTYRQFLRDMNVGETKIYPRRDHVGFVATKTTLKKKGEGEWVAKCGKFDKQGQVTRIK